MKKIKRSTLIPLVLAVYLMVMASSIDRDRSASPVDIYMRWPEHA